MLSEADIREIAAPYVGPRPPQHGGIEILDIDEEHGEATVIFTDSLCLGIDLDDGEIFYENRLG